MIDFSFLKNRQPGILGESEAYHSAVAITMVESPAGQELLFEVRSENIVHQPGDICCPGGMVETDETPEQAAVRELTEELLVKPEQVSVLGPLDVVYNGRMMVHPYVCLLKEYGGSFSKEEVSEIFRVPFSFFLDTAPEIHEVTWHIDPGEDFPFDKIHGGKNYPWRKNKERILFYEYDGRVIWGLTAKLMEALARYVKQYAIGRQGRKNNE